MQPRCAGPRHPRSSPLLPNVIVQIRVWGELHRVAKRQQFCTATMSLLRLRLRLLLTVLLVNIELRLLLLLLLLQQALSAKSHEVG